MTGLTQLKSNCSKALEECIKDCGILIETHKNTLGMEMCIELCRRCIDASADCIDACESAKIDRGMMMHTCAEACRACAQECEKHNLEECKICAVSCRLCLEEFHNLMA